MRATEGKSKGRGQAGLLAALVVTALYVTAAQTVRAGGGSNDTRAGVKVVLHSAADVGSREVCVADVATIEGGTPELRGWVGRLDLADPPRPGQIVRVTQSQVAFRIRLAGLDDRRFAVEGEREVRIMLSSYEVPDSEIVQAAQRLVQSRLPWDPEDVVIRLSQALTSKVVVPSDKSSVRLEPAIRSQRVPTGRVRVDVSVWAGDRKCQEVPVLLDVRVYQVVAIAKRRVERGQLLTEDNTQYDRRPIDDLTDFVTAKDSPIGQRSKRTIGAAQLIAVADIEPAELAKEILVKQGDVVKIVAHAGALKLSTNGEALQEGPAGKMIRVRNVDSKVVVTGRVLDRSTVEVMR